MIVLVVVLVIVHFERLFKIGYYFLCSYLLGVLSSHNPYP